MGAGADTLTEAIARAYAVFDVSAPSSLGVCTACCMDPAMERAMLRKRAAHLAVHEVREWLDAAYGHRPDVNVEAWILPRILDLLATGADVAGVGNEVALARLPGAGFPDRWTDAEVAVVQEVCHGLLDRHIAARKRDLDGLLCMFSKAGLSVEPFLRHLDAQPDAVLADLLYANWHWPVGMVIDQTAFWDDTRARDRVWAWYTSSSLEHRMTLAGFAGNDHAAAVSDALATYARSAWPD